MLEEDEDKLRAAGKLENGFEATVRGGVPVIVCKACDKAVASSTTAVAAKAVESQGRNKVLRHRNTSKHKVKVARLKAQKQEMEQTNAEALKKLITFQE